MLRTPPSPVLALPDLRFSPGDLTLLGRKGTAPQRYLQEGRRHPWTPLPPATIESMHDFHPEPSLPPTIQGSEATSATVQHEPKANTTRDELVKPHAGTRRAHTNPTGPHRRSQALGDPSQIWPSSTSARNPLPPRAEHGDPPHRSAQARSRENQT